ncbi:hypothetical protein [uncultured Intestinimonas sp.]|uniref:hypothetical protein n=1 Tax=uncultured Intestinimonas sp. TaxID=1689265 RepID=UPI00260005FC|nr:hypothetical protein [uncultured Intestinimonas sp.]
MKKWLARLGFRKMDEMERLIALKAQRNTLIYMVVFLVIWSLTNSLRTLRDHVPLDNIPGLLLSTAVLVLIGSQLYYQRKALAGSEEGRELMSGFWRFFLSALCLLVLLLAAGTWLVLG